MQHCIVSIDLGTTYFKFSLFDDQLSQITTHSIPVTYAESPRFVEFDAEEYWNECKRGIKEVLKKANAPHASIDLVSLTGQAESLVIADREGHPLCNAISWSDSRSVEECDILSQKFTASVLYATTGLPFMSPTWPATKLLWIKRHAPDLFARIRRVFLIKDFITFKLTGAFASEYSVFSFSCLFDLAGKKPWKAMCDYLELSEDLLPRLVEPATIVGSLRGEVADELGVSSATRVCIGALDHAAGMVGTGNIAQGILNETTGTVQALALKADAFQPGAPGIEWHYGARKDSYLQLLVCESGGICLQWFRDAFLPSLSFREVDALIESRMDSRSGLLFLPYITGSNSPEYDTDARGVFYGIRSKHEAGDFARAVMEANAFLLRKNIEYLERQSGPITEIYFLGGASRSDVWCGMKADITGKNVVTFANDESTCLGAAILGAVSAGRFDTVQDAVALSVKRKNVYTPRKNHRYEEMYGGFIRLYDRLFPRKGKVQWQ